MIPVTPPTDNLYKFMSVGGLVLISLCLTGLLRIDARMKTEVEQLSLDLVASFAELEAIVTEIKHQPTAADVRDLELRQVKLHGRLLEIQTRLQNRLDAEAGETVLGVAALIGAGIGIAISAVGFWLWYRRIQVPQDAKLKRGSITHDPE